MELEMTSVWQGMNMGAELLEGGSDEDASESEDDEEQKEDILFTLCKGFEEQQLHLNSSKVFITWGLSCAQKLDNMYYFAYNNMS